LSIQPISLPNKQTLYKILYWDIFWIGVLIGTTVSFQGVYAARLGASNLQMGLLGAGPAAMGLLYTLPAGLWMEGRPLIRVAFASAFWMRLGYLGLFLLPWLINPQAQIWGIIVASLILTIPATLLNIAFNANFAEIVPPEDRAEVVARRSALMAVSTTLSTLLSGQVLDRIVFPLNYQIVFLIGGLGAMISTYYVGKIYSAHEPAPLDKGWRNVLPRQWSLRQFFHLLFPPRTGKALVRLDLLRGPFGAFMAAFVVFYTFQFFPNPLYPLFYVNELHLPDSAISLGTAIFNGTMTLGALIVVNRLSLKIGHRWMLILGATLTAEYALLLAPAQSAIPFWVASLVGGPIWAILNVGTINRLMDRVPLDDRPAHMALYNLVVNIGILAGSLLGPAVSDWIGLRPALWLTAVMQLLAGFFFWLVG